MKPIIGSIWDNAGNKAACHKEGNKEGATDCDTVTYCESVAG